MKNSAQLLLAFSAAVATAAAGCSKSSPQEYPLVNGLTLSQVAAYQTLKTTLMTAGAANTAPEVPIIIGKPLTLRAFVAAGSGWDGHPVNAHFELTSGGVTSAVDVNVPSSSSTEGDYSSTANLDLTGAQVTADLTFSVSLRELKKGAHVDAPAAIYPADLTEANVGAQDTGDGEHIVVIPYAYMADGSGRLPDTSDAQIKLLHDRMLSFYPVNAVDIQIADPVQWTSAIQASGKGWGRLLQSTLNKRLNDGVPDNTYYYGMFAPAASFEAFCTEGCVLGLSEAATDPNDNTSRGSVGVSYPDKEAESDITFVHEIGHAHGREHAPCGGAADPDVDFPYPNGGIGDWGFDFVTKKLWDPAGDARDMMGYCDPDWISDYTFKALYDRVRWLNLNIMDQAKKTTAKYRSIVIDTDGEAVRGDIVTAVARGNEKMIERFAEDGSSEQFTGHYYPFDHIKGGILLVPLEQDRPDLGTMVFNGTIIK